MIVHLQFKNFEVYVRAQVRYPYILIEDYLYFDADTMDDLAEARVIIPQKRVLLLERRDDVYYAQEDVPSYNAVLT